jgi:DNA (cytosine-5)-methyltransferase 1
MTFYEFFAGAGMARLGLGAGWTCTFANDIDPAKMCSYVANFGAQGAMTRDVARLTVADLLGAVALAWASFPCQDVSLAGDRAGLDGARSSTFWSFWRLMQALRAEGRAPKLIVIENVRGLLTSHGGKDFDAICGALAACDYRFGAVVIDAALFVPQSRERVFIIAIDEGLDMPAGIFTTTPSLPFYSKALVAALRRQKAAPVWFNLPMPPARNTALVDLIEDQPTGVAWHVQAETNRLIGMMARPHLAKLDEARRTGKRIVGPYYKRMRPPPGGSDEAGKRVQRVEVRFDDVAGCLRMASSGGSSVQTVMVVDGPSVRSRRLSTREAARLMGVPDDYRLPGNYIEGYDLMADGVAVPVVRHLAQHILEPILQAPALRRAAE